MSNGGRGAYAPDPGAPPSRWLPFRPGPQDLERIAQEVAAIPDIQAALCANHPDLKTADRGAHQYQIAGGRVELRLADVLPAELEGVGLFEPGAVHRGVGRISTGLGNPHLETDPDFLGLMAAFVTRAGQRVDFLAINDPTSPTDDHHDFIALLKATAASAGTEAPFGGKAGELDLLDLAAVQTRFALALVQEMGIKDGLRTLGHIISQTFATARSSSAWQTYWTGVVEVGGRAGKLMFEPTRDENPLRALQPGERHLSEDWRERQRNGDVALQLSWLPFANERDTPTGKLTERWLENPRPVGRLIFPQTAPDGDAWQWAALAAEMGANPGNWVHDRGHTVAHPATEFGVARTIAYRASQHGRNALPPELYAEVFVTGQIGAALAAELQRRRAEKQRVGHRDCAPGA